MQAAPSLPLKQRRGKNQMNTQGWKTYLAAAAAILAGIVAVTQGHYAEGASGVIGGLALVGVRGAIAKVIEAILSKQGALAFVAGLTLLMICSLPARAQTKNNEATITVIFVRQDPHFTRADFKYNQATDQVGAAVSLTHYFGESAFGLTADVGATAQGRSATDASLVTLVLGPTVKARNRKLAPYAHLLIGVSRLAARNQQLKFDKSKAGLAVIAGGGVDWRLSERFAVRVFQVDFVGTRALGSTVNNARVGAGLVINF
jgi:hypothetical protein